MGLLSKLADRSYVPLVLCLFPEYPFLTHRCPGDECTLCIVYWFLSPCIASVSNSNHNKTRSRTTVLLDLHSVLLSFTDCWPSSGEL